MAQYGTQTGLKFWRVVELRFYSSDYVRVIRRLREFSFSVWVAFAPHPLFEAASFDPGRRRRGLRLVADEIVKNYWTIGS